MARQLVQKGVIDSVPLFKMCVRMADGRVQSGEYEFPPYASAWRVARMLATGDVAATTVVIPEGLTIRQIKQLLLQAQGLSGAVECDGPSDMPVCNLRDGDVFLIRTGWHVGHRDWRCWIWRVKRWWRFMTPGNGQGVSRQRRLKPGMR